jgi:hypothetical protein
MKFQPTSYENWTISSNETGRPLLTTPPPPYGRSKNGNQGRAPRRYCFAAADLVVTRC